MEQRNKKLIKRRFKIDDKVKVSSYFKKHDNRNGDYDDYLDQIGIITDKADTVWKVDFPLIDDYLWLKGRDIVYARTNVFVVL